MADDIVAGLFGLTPYQIQQQRNAQLEQQATGFAGMNPFQQANYALYKGGAALGNIGAGMLGMQDPAMQQAQMQQHAMSGGDFNTPSGLRSIAQKLQASGNTAGAMYLINKANEIESATSKQILEARKQAAVEQKEAFKETQEFEFKQEQARLKLEADAKEAERRAEDKRLDREQRAAAAAEANAIKLEIARLAASFREDKKAEKQQTKEEAKKGFGTSIDFLESQYKELDKLGGIVSTEKSSLENIKARLASSDVGQYIGGTIGSEEQSIRNQINGTIPLLVLDIKNLTGASAQQMNSNVELQNFLKAASSPKTDIKTVLSLLKNLKEKYISEDGVKDKKSLLKTPPTDADINATALKYGITPAEVKRRLGI